MNQYICKIKFYFKEKTEENKKEQKFTEEFDNIIVPSYSNKQAYWLLMNKYIPKYYKDLEEQCYDIKIYTKELTYEYFIDNIEYIIQFYNDRIFRLGIITEDEMKVDLLYNNNESEV